MPVQTLWRDVRDYACIRFQSSRHPYEAASSTSATLLSNFSAKAVSRLWPILCCTYLMQRLRKKLRSELTFTARAAQPCLSHPPELHPFLYSSFLHKIPHLYLQPKCCRASSCCLSHSPYLLVLTTRATSSEFQIIFSLFFCFNTVFHFLNSSYVSCPQSDFAEPYLTTFLTSPPFAVLPPVRTSCKLNYCAAHPSLLHHYDR